MTDHELSYAVRRTRLERNLNQTNAAEQIGVSLFTLSRIETTGRMNFNTRERLMRWLRRAPQKGRPTI